VTLLGQGVGLGDHRGPLQPRPVCDSVILISPVPSSGPAVRFLLCRKIPEKLLQSFLPVTVAAGNENVNAGVPPHLTLPSCRGEAASRFQGKLYSCFVGRNYSQRRL